MRSLQINLIIVILSLVSLSSNAEETVAGYEAAEKAFQSHQYSTSETYLKNLLAANNKHLAAKRLLIKVYLAQGKGHLAESELQNAHLVGINSAEIKLLMAQAFTLQGKYNKALEMLSLAENDPDFTDQVYVEKGLAQIGLGHFKVAERTFQQAIDHNPANNDAKLGLAQVYIIENDDERASSLLDDVLASYLPPLESYTMKANIVYKQGRLNEALLLVNIVLTEDPNDFPSQLLRASIYIEQGNLDAADHDLELILNRFPNEPRATFLKAIIAAQNQHEDVSDSALSNVFEVVENLDEETLKQFPSYYYLVGYSAFVQGQLDQAKSYLNKYISIDENSYRALRLSASIDFALGHHLTALATLKKANMKFPDDPAILSLLGTLYLVTENKEKALFYFEKAQSLASNVVIFDAQLAQALILNDKPAEAERLLTHAIKSKYKDSDSHTMLEPVLLEAYIAQQKFEQALSVSKIIVNKLPKAINHFQLGLIYLSMNDIELAKIAIDEALSVDALFIPAVKAKSEILHRTGKSEQAIALAEKVYAETQNAELAFTLAKLYADLNEIEKSEDKILKAYQVAPENFEITRQYIALLIKRQQSEKAMAIAQDYNKAQPNELRAYFMLADLHLANNKTTEAHQVLKSAFRLTINDAEKAKIHLAIAAIYAKSFNVQDAITEYQKALAWHQNASTLYALARYYRKLGRIDESNRLIEANVNKITSDEITLLYGQNLLLQGKMSLAIRYFERIEDQYPQAQVGKAQALLGKGQTKAAKKYLGERIAQHPNHPLLLMTQAELWIGEQDWQKAFDNYEKVIKLHGVPTVYNNAAYTALQLNKLAQAKAYAEKAVSLNDQQPDALDTLGLTLHAMADYQAALPYFRKALVLDKNRPDVKYHLAQTLFALDRNREAMTLLAEILNSNAQQVLKDQAKQQLDSLLDKK